MKHKKIIKILLILLTVVFFGGCSSQTKIKSIHIDSPDITLDLDQSQTFKVEIEPSKANIEEKDIVISDTTLITLTKVSDRSLTIKANQNEGIATLYIMTNNVESNKVTINIVDIKKAKEKIAQEEKEAKEAAEKEKQAVEAEAKALEEQKQAEAAAKALEEQKQAEAAQSNESTSNNAIPNTSTVYLPKSGKKYHSNPNCSNMKNPRAVSLKEAQSLGYEPCSKCY
ncbi:MAG: hypothetical protein ACLRVU_03625 [Beduini sp.]|uniref:hypothetical protein n=1 Tax=Beduini sp. TaxID=1922300 RepID=UPI0039A306E3